MQGTRRIMGFLTRGLPSNGCGSLSVASEVIPMRSLLLAKALVDVGIQPQSE